MDNLCDLPLRNIPAMSAMDLRQGSIECEICGVGFVNMAVLKEHKNNHGVYMCSICSKFFSTEFILEDHQLTVHNKIDPNLYVYVMDSGYKCFCKKQYKHKTFLAEHLRKSHRCFICVLGQGVSCDTIYKDRHGLELHQKQCHSYNALLDKNNSTSGEPINKNVRKNSDDMEIINVDCDLNGESPEVPTKVVAEAETVKKTEEQKSLQAIDPAFYLYRNVSGYACFCKKQYKHKTFLAEHLRKSHRCFICILGQGVSCDTIYKNRLGLELHQKQCHSYNALLDKKNSTSSEPINKNVRKDSDDMEIINVDCDLNGESSEVPTKVVAEAEAVKKTEEPKSLQAIDPAFYLYRNDSGYKCFCKKQFKDTTLLAKHLRESLSCHSSSIICVLGQDVSCNTIYKDRHGLELHQKECHPYNALLDKNNSTSGEPINKNVRKNSDDMEIINVDSDLNGESPEVPTKVVAEAETVKKTEEQRSLQAIDPAFYLYRNDSGYKCFCKKQYKHKTFLAEHLRKSHRCFICILGQGISCDTIYRNRHGLELHQKQCHPYNALLDKKNSTFGEPINKNVRKDSDDMEIINVDCDLNGESTEVPSKVVAAETVKKTEALSSSNAPQVLRRSSREHKAVNRLFPGVAVDSMLKSSGDTFLEVDDNIVSDGIGNDDGGLVDNDSKSDSDEEQDSDWSIGSSSSNDSIFRPRKWSDSDEEQATDWSIGSSSSNDSIFRPRKWSDSDEEQDSDWSIGSSSSNDSIFRPKTISGKNKSQKLVSNSSNVEGHVSNEMSSARRSSAMSCGLGQSDTEPIEVDIHELANYGLYFGCTDCQATFQTFIDAQKHYMECNKVSSIPKQSMRNNTVISDPQQDNIIVICDAEDGMRDDPVSFDSSTANNKSLSGDRYDMECDNIPVDPHDDVVESDFDEDDDLQVEGSEQPGANTLLLNSDVHAMRLNYYSSLSDSISVPDDSILASQTTAVSTPLDHDSQPPRYGIINIKTELENDYGDSVYTNMTSSALTESVTIKQEPTFLKIERKLMSTMDSDCTSSVMSTSANNVATPLNIVQNVHTVYLPNVQLAAEKRVNSDPSF